MASLGVEPGSTILSSGGGAKAADGVVPDSKDGRSTQLAALLLNFLKQYHLVGQADAIREMLCDVCADGREPTPLGHWGVISPSSVREAISAYEVWKMEGQVGMPAYYKSNTHKQDLNCFVIRRTPEGSLDLSTQPVVSEFHTDNTVKHKADVSFVRPRPHPGWFVPELPGRQDTGDSSMGQKIARSTPATGGAPSPRWTMLYQFEGAGWGPEYLVLNVGDEIERISEDHGWAYGRVVQRAGVPLSTESITQGWYPASFAQKL
uniref:SH3 domain-containing protein n=1 Tax=Noctiluca scintillans TaxID=2966 RepID=A0A7S1A959_NOCSC|mmetsp:Transcript_36282/g.96435  ORF Transcript_36282/g.96435 Transcript_36282/m.96435 type:complete len:263 (+) Transcript_36282:58-846(+)